MRIVLEEGGGWNLGKAPCEPVGSILIDVGEMGCASFMVGGWVGDHLRRSGVISVRGRVALGVGRGGLEPFTSGLRRSKSVVQQI